MERLQSDVCVLLMQGFATSYGQHVIEWIVTDAVPVDIRTLHTLSDITVQEMSYSKGRKGNVIHSIECSLVKEAHRSSTQVRHALSRDVPVSPAHPRVYPRMERTKPAFAFPAEAGPHLPKLDGWKAELA